MERKPIELCGELDREFSMRNLIPIYNLVRLHREKPLSRENFPNLTDNEFHYFYRARIRKAIVLGAYNMALIYPILEKISDKIF